MINGVLKPLSLEKGEGLGRGILRSVLNDRNIWER
jgi:hypothetical protein